MSPTENDLRAALHDGEGDGLDAGRIVAQGERLRAKRRSRLINTAATVVVVAGVATGGALLANSGGGGERTSANAGAAASSSAPGRYSTVDRGAAAGGGAASVPAMPSPRAAAGGLDAVCPQATPGSPPAPKAAAGQLFAGTPVRIRACAYAGSGTLAKSVTLTGADTQAVLASLARTSATKPTGMCPDYRLADELTLTLTGLDAQGTPLGSVVTNLGRPACATTVSNGATVRYGWQPPAVLDRLQPIGGMSHGPVAPPTK